MSQVVHPDVMTRLAPLGSVLAGAAMDESEAILSTDGAGEEEIAQARVVTAVQLSVLVVLRALPLSEAGLIVSLASIYATVLSQCEADRRVLHAAFKHQLKVVLEEMALGAQAPAGSA